MNHHITGRQTTDTCTINDRIKPNDFVYQFKLIFIN